MNVTQNAKGLNIGYKRVSSVGQNLGRQLNDLTLDKIFEEKESGAKKERPSLIDCLDYCREGDTLHVHSIDRLARNLSELQRLVLDFNHKGVVVKFHKENLTFNPNESDLFNQLMLQMLGAFAEFERNMIKERQLEGIKNAQAQGVKFGRPKKLNAEQEQEIIKLVKEQGQSINKTAKQYNVSRRAIDRIIK